MIYLPSPLYVKGLRRKKRQQVEYYRNIPSQSTYFPTFQISCPDGLAALWESNRAHPEGLPKKIFLLAPAFWTVYPSWINFKEVTEQAQKCTQHPDAYPNCLKPSNWLSNLSRAGIASTVLKIPFSSWAPNTKRSAYGWLFRTFALYFCSQEQRCAVARWIKLGWLLGMPKCLTHF